MPGQEANNALACNPGTVIISREISSPTRYLLNKRMMFPFFYHTSGNAMLV
jgi:hypothetical protein